MENKIKGSVEKASGVCGPKSSYYILDISRLLHYNNFIFIFLRKLTQ